MDETDQLNLSSLDEKAMVEIHDSSLSILGKQLLILCLISFSFAFQCYKNNYKAKQSLVGLILFTATSAFIVPLGQAILFSFFVAAGFMIGFAIKSFNKNSETAVS
ncbi:hypothetical protein ACWJJH_02995 [Endozoicomonadaceae bacterium StTr2]